MNGLESKYVSISLVDKVFKISCGGYRIWKCRIIRGNSGNIFINKQKGFEDVNIYGKYELKHLLLFTKCTNLCNSIEIYEK